MGLGIVLLILCAVLCAIISERKGNSPIAGFFAGLLLGPFGVLIVIFETGPKSNMRKCPYCRGKMELASTFCPLCRRQSYLSAPHKK